MANSGGARKLGLLGDLFDPAAQLLQDLPGFEDTEFVELFDPRKDADVVDEILVLDQGEALANLPALIACGKPCRLLLRRPTRKGEETTWQASLRWLQESLRLSECSTIEIAALSRSAADAIMKHIDMPVLAFGTLPKIPTERSIAEVIRGSEATTFTYVDRDGSRQTRRVDLDSINWVRLRRLAILRAGDAADLDMQDLVEFANGSETAVTAPSNTDKRPCVLAVVPNGVGLGHITRMMAIANGLNASHDVRIVFWSYSRAAEILRSAGFEVILRQNAVHLDAHPPSWRRWETEEFARTLIGLKASLVSMDGGNFDQFIVDALKRPGCGRCGVLWVRRGMLKPETDALILETEQICDLVLEPGDLSVEMDKGPTRTRSARSKGFSRSITTKPVTLKPFLPSYTRREAKRKLGLGWGRHCLVSLGGAFGDWDLLKSLLDRYAKSQKVKLIWAQSPLAPPPDETTTKTDIRQFYPLSRYMAAFDGMVTATGYNSYHELMLGYDGPVLLAPTNRDRLDDQEARARYAEEQGWAHVVYASRLLEQEQTIEAFMSDVGRRKKMLNRPQISIDPAEYADEIQHLFERYK